MNNKNMKNFIIMFLPLITMAFPNLREQTIIIEPIPNPEYCKLEGLCYFIGDEGNGVCGDCE